MKRLLLRAFAGAVVLTAFYWWRSNQIGISWVDGPLILAAIVGAVASGNVHQPNVVMTWISVFLICFLLCLAVFPVVAKIVTKIVTPKKSLRKT